MSVDAFESCSECGCNSWYIRSFAHTHTHTHTHTTRKPRRMNADNAHGDNDDDDDDDGYDVVCRSTVALIGVCGSAFVSPPVSLPACT